MQQTSYTRRRFLGLGILAGFGTVYTTDSLALSETPTTPSAILGP
jgi:hypothetical protein